MLSDLEAMQPSFSRMGKFIPLHSQVNMNIILVLGGFMDFLAFALEMEDKIIQNCKKLAEQCLPHEGIRRILMMLAMIMKNMLNS